MFNKKHLLWIYVALLFPISDLYSDNQKFVLIVPLYNEKDHSRVEEYLHCLKKNLEHPLITDIHVLYDTGTNASEKSAILKFLKKKKITVSSITGRATFEQCFTLANTFYPHRPVIISNADIYFNETLYLLKDYDLENKFLALTRWDVQKDGTLKPFIKFTGESLDGSQDVWIFKTPIRRFNNAKMQLGTTWCDGRIAYQAKKEGLSVVNPCKSIQCCHLHLSNVRNYKVTKKPSQISATEASYL